MILKKNCNHSLNDLFVFFSSMTFFYRAVTIHPSYNAVNRLYKRAHSYRAVEFSFLLTLFREAVFSQKPKTS